MMVWSTRSEVSMLRKVNRDGSDVWTSEHRAGRSQYALVADLSAPVSDAVEKIFRASGSPTVSLVRSRREAIGRTMHACAGAGRAGDCAPRTRVPHAGK